MRSDHAGRNQNNLNINRDGGPSWVGHIINAVGNSTCTGDDHPNWSNTVILVTWDDWGGWYDHVNPHQDLGGPGGGYSNGDGLWYVYGFRVPLLVISAYNKHTTGVQGYTGYISGSTGNPVCPGPTCHDFGSILNFVEFTFGSGGGYLGFIGHDDPNSTYADVEAPDSPSRCQQACPYSLSDFFRFDLPPNTFATISGFKYQETCFHTPNQTGCWPNTGDEDPDNDALEQ